MHKQIPAKKILATSLLVDLLDISLNILVAAITGSVVMLAGALQGLADLTSVGLLLIGHRRSERPADRVYQFGYGKEIYFWSLAAGMIIFTITASFSFYSGLQSFIRPGEIEHLPWAFAVLLFAIFSNGYAFSLSLRRILRDTRTRNPWRGFNRSLLVESKTTFILDLMGTLSAASGLTALLIFRQTGDSRFDGLGAMVIGVIMAVLALLLLAGIRDLVVGRSAPANIQKRIIQAALKVQGVRDILDIKTMLLGTHRYLVILEIHAAKHLSTKGIEELTDVVKETVQHNVPSAYHIQVEIETPD